MSIEITVNTFLIIIKNALKAKWVSVRWAEEKKDEEEEENVKESLFWEFIS